MGFQNISAWSIRNPIPIVLLFIVLTMAGLISYFNLRTNNFPDIALPVVVVSVDDINRLPLVITVVVGTKGANITRDYPTNVRLAPTETGLPLETVMLCFQLRSLDSARFPVKPAGRLSDEALTRLEAAVRYCLGL